MSEQRDFVDFQNGGDTGQDTLDSIQPYNTGEGAVQTVLRRPVENVRSRTEILRDEITTLQYYRDYEQLMLEYPSSDGLTAYPAGTLTWGGPTSFSGPNNTGIITASGYFRISPLLAPKTSKKATISIGTAAVNQLIYTVAATAYATHGMNAITIEHRNAGVGASLSVNITSGPVKRLLVIFDDANVAHDATATKALLDSAISADTDLASKLLVTTSAAASNPILEIVETRLEGTADDELHTVDGTNLASFSLDVGDGIAIWYRYAVEPTGGFGSDPKGGVAGGRAESSNSRGTSSIPIGSLFKTSAAANKIPGAVPICRVAYNGQLVFFDGTRIQPGETASFASPTSVASAALTAHINNLATTAGAGIVGYNGSGNWADGVQAIASGSTVENAIDEIVSDLAAISAPAGALHIGVDAATLFSTGGTGLTAGGAGGARTTDTLLRSALSRLHTEVISRRSFTAVCTDGATSTGGDLNNTNLFTAINTQAFGSGAYFVRRGTYAVASDLVSANAEINFVGESRKDCILSAGAIRVLDTGSTSRTISFENVMFSGTADSTGGFECRSGSFKFINCEATAGSLRFIPDAVVCAVNIDGLDIIADATLNRNNSLRLVGTNQGTVTGTISKLTINLVPARNAATQVIHALQISGMTSGINSNNIPLVFNNAKLRINTGFDPTPTVGSVLRISSNTQPLVFRDSRFELAQGNATLDGVVIIDNAQNITFENCVIINGGYGRTLRVTGTCGYITFRRCTFLTNTYVALSDEIQAYSNSTGLGPITFEDCYIELRHGDGTTSRRIELGADGGVGQNTTLQINRLLINLNYYANNLLNNDMLTIATAANVDAWSHIRDITIDFNAKRLNQAAANAVTFRGTGSAGMHVDGLHLLRVAEPIAPADGNCTLVSLARCSVHGGSLSGSPQGADAEGWKGIFSTTTEQVTISGLTLWESGPPNRGRLFLLNGSRCYVRGNRLAVTNLAVNESVLGWFAYLTDNSNSVTDNSVMVTGTLGAYADVATNCLVYLAGTADSNVISNNLFNVTAPLNHIFLKGNDVGGFDAAYNVITGNTHRCASSGLRNLVVFDADTAKNVLTSSTFINTVGTASYLDVDGGASNVIGNLAVDV